jgi:hypothetical protein
MSIKYKLGLMGVIKKAIIKSGTAPMLDEKIQKDVEVLGEFIFIYCSEMHRGEKLFSAEAGGDAGRYLEKISNLYCRDCRKLLLHSVAKRILCPYNPKPACKKCETHCCGKGYREKIREVMRFTGKRLIKQGRFDLIKKYFF